MAGLMHEDYRRRLARLAGDEDVATPDDPRYLAFLAAVRQEMLDAWPPEAALWNWATDSRPIAEGCELALLVDQPMGRVDDHELVRAVKFYMRRDDTGDWLLASLNE